jgi:hypothetical protein
VLGSRVLRKIFGSKRKEVIGEWRRLHIEELHCLLLIIYTSDDKTKKNCMSGACDILETEEVHTGFGVFMFVCGPEVKRTLGSSTRSLEDKVQMSLQQVGWGMN